MGDTAGTCTCGRALRDDGVHVDTGLYACAPDSGQLAMVRAFSDEMRREN